MRRAANRIRAESLRRLADARRHILVLGHLYFGGDAHEGGLGRDHGA